MKDQNDFFIGDWSIGGDFEWSTACCGQVSFRTNGPQGGDAGHGGVLRVSFHPKGSTDLTVYVDGEKFYIPQCVTLEFAGDHEIYAAVDCFEYLAKHLRFFLDSEKQREKQRSRL